MTKLRCKGSHPIGLGAPDDAAIASLKRSIADHIESMSREIMPVQAADAANWIIERLATSFVLVPKQP
jgi:hypothetical protein